LRMNEAYVAAFYSAGGFGLNEAKLVAFPLAGEASTIALPVALGRFAYSSDGTALYTETAPAPETRWRLVKINLDPIGKTWIPGSADIGALHSIAVSSSEEIVFSGSYRAGEDRECGIFKLTPSTQHVRKIVGISDCSYVSSWRNLSLSPVGLWAVAVRQDRVELIDMTTGDVRSLGNGFQEATWSPDSRWIAELKNASEEAFLVETRNFSTLRVLKTSGVTWSPDSKYLLGLRATGCSGYSGTLEMVEAASGKKTAIASSKCKVNQTTAGWISVRQH
jgi:hypothetical protein